MNTEQYKKLIERANKRPKKSDRQRLKGKLDKMCSEYVRRRDFKQYKSLCPRCGHSLVDWHKLQWAHLISRVHLKTRWNESAAIGICAGCHFYVDSHAEVKIAFAVQILGQERYDILLDASTRTDYKVDMKLIELYLQKLLEEV